MLYDRLGGLPFVLPVNGMQVVAEPGNARKEARQDTRHYEKSQSGVHRLRVAEGRHADGHGLVRDVQCRGERRAEQVLGPGRDGNCDSHDIADEQRGARDE